MATLSKAVADIELTVAKPTGLNDLGVPIGESTLVKKGRMQEFLQTLDNGAIGRRYQNIRVTAIKTTEGGRTFSKLFVQFEVFADDWVSVGDNTGVEFDLRSEGMNLYSIPQGRIFLPYCRSWYENQYERTIPNDAFDAVTRFQFVANQDQVQPA